MQTLLPQGRKMDAQRPPVLLVVPRWTSPNSVSQGTIQGTPFRSLRIAGALLAAGYPVHLFDQDLEERKGVSLGDGFPSDVHALVFWCNELEPLIQSTQAFYLQEKFRRLYPQRPLILGGPLIARLPTEGFWSLEGFDFFLQSQGILELPLLLRAIEKQSGFDSVPGLIRSGKRTFEGPPPPKRFRVPSEVYDIYQMLDFQGWIQKGGIFGNDRSTLITSFTQGCAKGCSFCYWRDFPPAFLEPERAVFHLKRLRNDYGVCQFHLAELDFASNRKRLLSFAQAFGREIPDGHWFSLVSVSDMAQLSPEEWDQLRAGGMAKLEFGTESGSSKSLTRMGKRHNRNQVIQVTQEATKRGIHCMHNFVFGIPGESKKDLDLSLELIHTLRTLDPNKITFTFRFFQPPFGTPLGEEALAKTKEPPRRVDRFLASRVEFGQEHLRTMPWIPPALEKRIKALVYHYLPLASSKIPIQNPKSRVLYFILRRFAHIRLHHRFFSFPFDRKLYEKNINRPLDNTYTP